MLATRSLPLPALQLLRQLKAVLSSNKTADLSTEQGRSHDRYRRAFLTTLVSGLSKIVTVSTSLISVPLTLHYLGVQRYGLWMTIGSVIACLSFSDLGINNGLLNGISKANGTDNRILAQQYVSSAFFFLTEIAALIGLIFALTYHWIPWKSVFNLTSKQATAEAGPAVAALVACFLVTIPAGIGIRVQSGYQEGFGANLWSLLGSILGFLSLLAVVYLHGSLTYLVLASSGAPIIALIANSLYVFGKRRPWLRPSWSQVNWHISKDLLRTGFLFLVLQIAAAISFSADNLVIAQVLGPGAVAQYAIPVKLFSLSNLLVSFVANPLWPAYTEALARNDLRWVKKTFVRSIVLLGTTAILFSAILVVSAPAIIKAWVGPKIHPSFLLLIGLGLWGFVNAVSVPVSILLNAAAIIKFQIVTALVATLGNITLSIYLTRHIGVSGVVYGSVISQVALALIPYGFYTRRFFRSLSKAPIPDSAQSSFPIGSVADAGNLTEDRQALAAQSEPNFLAP